MISVKKARKVGINRCVDLIGRDFCITNKERSVCSFGEEDGIIDVFVGITDETRKPGRYCLSEKPWKYSAMVYVNRKNGEVKDGQYVSAIGK